MAWRIEIAETARKELRKLDRVAAKRILDYLEREVAVGDDPRRLGKALKGPLGAFWRYRVGDYRVICEIEDSVLRVLVVRIGHRREIYRR